MSSFAKSLIQTASTSETAVPSVFQDCQQAVNEAVSVGAVSRRGFLRLSSSVCGGFALASVVGTSVAGTDATKIDGEAAGETLAMNAFVHVAPSGAVTLYSHTPEMGQGVKTAIPMIIAEELGVNWQDVTVVQSPVNENIYGEQRAGGSRSINRTWKPMREMGAAAKHMFIAAAATAWGVKAAECKTSQSKVIHIPTGKQKTFAELAMKAAQQQAPKKSELIFKSKADFELLGTEVTGVDNDAIVKGEPLFGTDVQLPGMLHAQYVKCPAHYGKARSANLDTIKKLPGIVDAFIVEGNDDVMQLLDGVAIVGKTSWQVMQARQQLKVDWDKSNACVDSWTDMQKTASQLAKTSGEKEVINKGQAVNQINDKTNKSLSSFYTHPYVTHACMEPMNCTAHYQPAASGKPASMHVWAPTQAPSRIYGVVEKFCDVPRDQITIHQTRMGGGFGRRGRTDFSSEAAVISHRVKAPVKLCWSREDDIQHDFFRAGGFYQLKGAVDKQGKLVAMENHLIGPGFQGRPMNGVYQHATEFPAQCIDNYRSALTLLDTKTPCGPWRAPGSNVTAWATQSFIAEMAHLAKRDHLEFLLEIMGKPQWFEPGNIRSLNTGRAAGVIKLAAEKAGWGKPLPKGRGMGLAFYFSHAGHVAEVAEISVDANKRITVHNITAAVDIGPIVNKSGAVAQVQGAIIDGLSTMMTLEITMENGVVEQNNFHQYRPLRIAQTPPVAVHFIESDYDPTGIGEPALPPLAPAIGNAIFAATGERVRQMPINKSGYSLV